jgi:DNA excision repair protein ERCC-2
MRSLYLAITDFALPVPRSGSIETHSGYGPLPTTGLELHQLIQRERQSQHPEYQAEVQISHTFQTEKNRFHVNGRIDGFFNREVPRIEEIKTTFNVEELAKKLSTHDDHPYRLQLKTYAYLHWLKTDKVPETVLHIVSSRTGEGVDVEVPFDPEDFEVWLRLRLAELDLEVEAFEKLQKRRLRTSESFRFPFDVPRSGQLELIQSVEEGLGANKFLMLQAPTGMGKTAGVMYPVLQQALSRGQKTIYVTPKNSQHAVAEDAVRRFLGPHFSFARPHGDRGILCERFRRPDPQARLFRRGARARAERGNRQFSGRRLQRRLRDRHRQGSDRFRQKIHARGRRPNDFRRKRPGRLRQREKSKSHPKRPERF